MECYFVVGSCVDYIYEYSGLGANFEYDFRKIIRFSALRQLSLLFS